MLADDLARELVDYAREKLTRQLRQVIRCARLLSEEQLWHRANEHCNSVGNLMLHLAGNVRQWIISGIGGEPFRRDRPTEFAARCPQPADELFVGLEQVVQRAIAIIQGLDASALAARRSIQGYDVSTLAAVFHVVEHFSGHAGQIVHMTKALKDVDLSLYDAEGRQAPGLAP